MAFSKVVSRLSSRFTHKLTKTTSSPASELSSLKSSLHFPAPAPVRRISRLPLELSSVGSMMPLHSAIASARLTSSLSIESQSWGLVPQGISMPL
ncbi:protein NUCLEAR FUSION DEFECTIVE 6, mitochondrial [Rosa sericea]